MYVNVSRGKLLINNPNTVRKAKKKKTESTMRCNHCGGPIRANGEILACLMCSREANHVCANCCHVRPEEIIADSKKKAPDSLFHWGLYRFTNGPGFQMPIF